MADARALLKIARAAHNTYVGRHWPDMRDMRLDGIGFGLNDGEHEARIRRFLYEFQPEFAVQWLEGFLVQPSPGLDVEALALSLRDHKHVGSDHGPGCAEDIAARYDAHIARIAAIEEKQ